VGKGGEEEVKVETTEAKDVMAATCGDGAFLYVVIWQRMANSGICYVKANSPAEAIELIGYSPKCCKMTAIEVRDGSLIGETGKAN
jgi:hypothetical protein